jgi:hypothetical protein
MTDYRAAATPYSPHDATSGALATQPQFAAPGRIVRAPYPARNETRSGRRLGSRPNSAGVDRCASRSIPVR